MKKINTLILIVAILFCFNCKTNPDQKTKEKISNTITTVNGVWKGIGYGRIVNITDETISIYDVNNISCLPSDEFPREAAEQFLSFVLQNENTLNLKMARVEMVNETGV